MEYLELAEQYPLDDKYGRQVLIEALMARAVESVRRVVRIRDEKPSLSQMVSSGMIGGQLLDKINAAELEIVQELEELKSEAEIYKTGWGQTFIQEASNVARIQIQREKDLAEMSTVPEPEMNPISDEETRDRMMQELIDEEEEEKRLSATKRKGKKKSK